MKSRVLVVFGTRPEAIKMAPVVRALAASQHLDPVVCVTGQHRELLDTVNSVFGIAVDFDLNIMAQRQTLSEIAVRAVQGLSPVLEKVKPSCLLVQGDTTTAFAAALAASYSRIMVGHIEAGLRTFDKDNPFPEEINRKLISQVADYHYAPTERARRNLLAESVPADRILMTGNTVVDACNWMLSRPRTNITELPIDIAETDIPVLLTMHRRENWGEPMRRVCAAIRRLIAIEPRLLFLYPVHPNPVVRGIAESELASNPRVKLLGPQSYLPFLHLMQLCKTVLTDSGGVQEEIASLGKPVVVLREETERPEIIEKGYGVLAGTDPERIVDSMLAVLREWKRPAGATPFGDGNASLRITGHLERVLCHTADVRDGSTIVNVDPVLAATSLEENASRTRAAHA